MAKLNWRNAKEELPEEKESGSMELCIVRIQYTDDIGELCKATVYDWYNPRSRFGIVNDCGDEDYIGKWLENDGEVTHWIYADEIPLPEE